MKYFNIYVTFSSPIPVIDINKIGKVRIICICNIIILFVTKYEIIKYAIKFIINIYTSNLYSIIPKNFILIS